MCPDHPDCSILSLSRLERDASENSEPFFQIKLTATSFMQRHTRHLCAPDEDAKLMHVMTECGTSNWNAVAKEMKDHVPRQCRERWQFCLSLGHVKGGWTEAEDRRLLEFVKIAGSRWTGIQIVWPERSRDNIKNRWPRFVHQNDLFAINQAMTFGQHLCRTARPADLLDSTESLLMDIV
jgi:hypothetical protein